VAAFDSTADSENNTTAELAPAHTQKGTSMEPFLGQIQLLPYNFVPIGWAFCEGQEVSISQNTALFSLLGTMYGGNGTSTFALPNLKGQEPDPNMHYCIALRGIFPSRA
jgi:microcystin-dependent protein